MDPPVGFDWEIPLEANMSSADRRRRGRWNRHPSGPSSTPFVTSLAVLSVASALFSSTYSSPVFPFTSYSRKLFGGYRITPKFCNATRSLAKREPERRGPTICMFNHECFQRQGEVVGACMDGFLFGTCCELPLTPESLSLGGGVDPLMEQLNATEQQSGQSSSSLSSAIASQYEKFGSQMGGYGGESQAPVQDEAVDTSGGYTASSEKIGPLFTKIQNNNYIGNDDLDEDIVMNSISAAASKYDVANGAVSVYSPSTNKIKTDEQPLVPPSSSLLSSVGYPSTTESDGESHFGVSQLGAGGVYSSEIPSLLSVYGEHGDSGEASETGGGSQQSTETTAGDITATGVQQIANQILQENGQFFDHSDITHPAAETDLLNEHGSVDQSYANPADFSGIPQLAPAPVPDTPPPPSTVKPAKVTYPKPHFKPRPKPTPAATSTSSGGSGEQGSDQYVLVQTISNDTKNNDTAPVKPTVSMNSIPSIESIILMLNDSAVGPQYDTDGSTATAPSTSSDTTSPAPAYGTASIDYDRYGPTSFYITKPQKTDTTSNVPSTSYVYSPKPTKRPTLEPVVVQATLLTNAAGYGGGGQADPIPSSTPRPKPTKIIVSMSTSTTATKRPVLITSDTLASNYYGPATRPASTIAVSSVQPTKKVTTTVATKRPVPTTIQLPEYIVQSSTLSHQNPSTLANVNYIQIASASDSPSPTVHITPKPVVGLVTSSTWNNKHTQPPPQVAASSSRPGFYENTPPVYLSSMADFEGEGYFGSTSRPAAHDQTGSVTSATAIYTIVDGGNKISNFASSSTYPPAYGPTPSYGSVASYPALNRIPSQPSLQTYGQPAPIEVSTLKTELYTTPDDSNNFPPVRNPNLNITEATGSMSNITKIENGSPANGEDKVNLLVNKLVASFNGNLAELEQILKDRNNLTAVSDAAAADTSLTSTTTAKPKKKKKRPSGNRKPANGTTTKKPTTAKPTALADTPVEGGGISTAVKPTTARPSKKPTKVRRPSNTTKPTSKPGSGQGVTLVNNKPPPSADTPSKPKPSNKPKPGSASSRPKPSTKPPTSTTKKPVRVSTTKKPTRKPSTARPTLADADLTTTTLTTRRPTKVTKRPTRRPTTTTSTTAAPEDETINEEENAVDGEDEEGDGEGEEDEDVGEETNEGEDEQPAGSRRILCGQRPLMKSGRVVGGKASKFGEWPWQVLVRESTWLGLFTKNKCGGVLITNEYVITAAHCQPGFLASLVAVFGEFDISSDLETKRSVTKNVKRVIVHRQYDAATFENDLAILELENPIHYDVHIVPICMPGDEADFTGRMATVTGWGRLTYGGGVPSVLQEVQVPVIENSVCQEMFHMAGHNKKILPSFVCAGYANGKRDSCEGDSGGPLVLQRPDGRYELVGTVSHGIRCAAPYLPGVYMRTTFYKPWLRSVTGVK
ncbi:serine protease filzig [Anopheles cruzii]|uniref:serine protease filzig n=1 Tax=Anopheles cruzii TaxID=68878 RepID=UPI0022EC1DDB|nr:serine protease filzig [Anopheles cruzii]